MYNFVRFISMIFFFQSKTQPPEAISWKVKQKVLHM